MQAIKLFITKSSLALILLNDLHDPFHFKHIQNLAMTFQCFLIDHMVISHYFTHWYFSWKKMMSCKGGKLPVHWKNWSIANLSLHTKFFKRSCDFILQGAPNVLGQAIMPLIWYELVIQNFSYTQMKDMLRKFNLFLKTWKVILTREFAQFFTYLKI